LDFLLRSLPRVICAIFIFIIIDPVRGGTYFLCCAAAPKKAKKGASPHNRLSVALEGHTVCGATLFMPQQFKRAFEHRSLQPPIPTRFAISAKKICYPKYHPYQNRG
jgi:hypothetical protein